MQLLQTQYTMNKVTQGADPLPNKFKLSRSTYVIFSNLNHSVCQSRVLYYSTFYKSQATSDNLHVNDILESLKTKTICFEFETLLSHQEVVQAIKNMQNVRPIKPGGNCCPNHSSIPRANNDPSFNLSP